MSLTAKEVKLVQESWEVACGKTSGITQTGVELFIRYRKYKWYAINQFSFSLVSKKKLKHLLQMYLNVKARPSRNGFKLCVETG